jgi:hypothetical protein
MNQKSSATLPAYLVFLDYQFLCISLKSHRLINGLSSASTSKYRISLYHVIRDFRHWGLRLLDTTVKSEGLLPASKVINNNIPYRFLIVSCLVATADLDESVDEGRVFHTIATYLLVQSRHPVFCGLLFS